MVGASGCLWPDGQLGKDALRIKPLGAYEPPTSVLVKCLNVFNYRFDVDARFVNCQYVDADGLKRPLPLLLEVQVEHG